MRILLGYDGSSDAQEAADLVGGAPWPTGSTVRVIAVIEPTVLAATAWPAAMPEYGPEADRQIGEYYASELAGAVRRLEGPDRTVESGVLRGRAATAIVDDAEAFGADLVVVGSRGRGAIGSLILGSVSGEVVDHAPCPVLIARGPTVTRVVFATDGSPAAVAAQQLLTAWPMFRTVQVHVVSVADVPAPWHTGIAPTMYGQFVEAHARDLEDAKRAHQRIATETAEALRAAGLDATGETLVGDAATEIIAASSTFGADLIVLGSRGRTGLTRLVLGSVARNVAHGSATTTLVVREATSAQARG
jgi:nucleotide-binding universal stress UspA family protein